MIIPQYCQLLTNFFFFSPICRKRIWSPSDNGGARHQVTLRISKRPGLKSLLVCFYNWTLDIRVSSQLYSLWIDIIAIFNSINLIDCKCFVLWLWCIGPLGQGIANAVGLALAERHLAARFTSLTMRSSTTTRMYHFMLFILFIDVYRPICLIHDHRYVLLGDDCNMEGISNEACSLAGHWGLGKLIAFYDDNHISIDGDTEIAFTEDVSARFEALGWRTGTLAMMRSVLRFKRQRLLQTSPRWSRWGSIAL